MPSALPSIPTLYISEVQAVSISAWLNGVHNLAYSPTRPVVGWHLPIGLWVTTATRPLRYPSHRRVTQPEPKKFYVTSTRPCVPWPTNLHNNSASSTIFFPLVIDFHRFPTAASNSCFCTCRMYWRVSAPEPARGYPVLRCPVQAESHAYSWRER